MQKKKKITNKIKSSEAYQFVVRGYWNLDFKNNRRTIKSIVKYDLNNNKYMFYYCLNFFFLSAYNSQLYFLS